MRKSFDALWQVMEARRRQVEAGEVPPVYRFEQARQARRRARGCPDEEALCGWADGQLRRHSLGGWLTVWRHVQIRRCRECQAEVAALAATMRPDQLGLAWRGSVPKRLMTPWLLARSPLAWASSTVVIVVGLALWSLGTHDSFLTIGDRSMPSLTDDAAMLPPVDVGNTLDDQTENTTIWGD
jgi:hypothetical protein